MKRVAVLMAKEFVRGQANFMLTFAIVVPVVITLLVSLLFGTIFSGKARLGLAAAGDSQVVSLAQELDSLIVEEFESGDALRDAVERGAVDVGIALPASFDSRARALEPVEITAYVWGESQLKHRAVAGTTFVTLVREVAGQEPPVNIVTTTLGDEPPVSWEERLMPFIVLMTILIGGVMATATAVVDEKQHRTLAALTITPMTLGEVLTAKALFGIILSTVMGVVILTLNRAFGAHPALLTLVLFLGSVMAATFGILLGIFIKDINSLFATIKGLGILLYAPALVYLFPTIPQWIGRLFPTYYMVQPVVELTQQGGAWPDVAPEVLVLVLLDLLLMGVVFVVVRRSRRREIIGVTTA